jgi:DNA-binding CsgD family transcriptional regulator
MISDDPTQSDPSSSEMEKRVARLTPGQLDCLRMVDQHMSSKEISGELGISPHTVDQRIRQALHILGVERRSQAARIVARHRPYQRLLHQSPHIEAMEPDGHSDPAIGIQIRHADRAGGLSRPVSIPSRGRFRGPSCNRRSPRGATPAMR